jgi:hypothetical protein
MVATIEVQAHEAMKVVDLSRPFLATPFQGLPVHSWACACSAA